MGKGGEYRTSEERLIQFLRKGLKRHPRQRNSVFSSDAELIEVTQEMCLAVTTDSLQEEIQLGILENPWTIGWTAVVINLSDLAAVGAAPLGILLSWTLPPNLPSASIQGISKGVADAARSHGTYVLGGDLNSGQQLQICGTALGTVRRSQARQRLGLQPGDTLFLSGPIGLGNALGFAKLRHLPEAGRIENHYRPKARFDLQKIVRQFSSCCIDTSDGLLAGLDVLARLNECGIVFRHRTPFYHSNARRLAKEHHLPLWLFAAAENGEFELLFSVRPDHVAACRRYCAASGISLIEIGRAVKEEGIWMESLGQGIRLNVPEIRRLATTLANNPQGYIESLTRYAQELSIS